MQEQRDCVQKSPILSLLHVDRNLSAEFKDYNCMGVKNIVHIVIVSFFQFFVLGHFPFVRTDRPDHSHRNENFTLYQNYPATLVSS